MKSKLCFVSRGGAEHENREVSKESLSIAVESVVDCVVKSHEKTGVYQGSEYFMILRHK